MILPRRVLLVAANAAGALTGNERTTLRIARLLREAGVDVVLSRPGEPVPTTPDVDLVHAFHLRRSGPRALDVAAKQRVPVIVSATGTDLGVDLLDDERGAVVRSVLLRSDGLACGNDDEAALARDLTRPGVPVVVVPKGVALSEAAEPARQAAGDCPLVLCLAHVRRVKRLDVAILALRHLRVTGAAVRLAIVGQVLEEDEEARLRSLAGDAEWGASFRGAVGPDEVPGWLAAADVVLNTSDVEGGSNAVLEAMAAGCAVVASDVPGNAQLVGRDGSRGLLYGVSHTAAGAFVHSLTSCAASIARLIEEPETRRRLGAAARDHVRRTHSLDGERTAWLDLYARVLASSRDR